MGESYWYEFTPEGIVIFHWRPDEQHTIVHQFLHDVGDRIREAEEAHREKMTALLREIVSP